MLSQMEEGQFIHEQNELAFVLQLLQMLHIIQNLKRKLL